MEELKLDIDYEQLNKDIQGEKAKLQAEGGQEMGPEDIAHMFQDLSTSFDQRYYVSIINKFAGTVSKRIKLDKNKEYEMPACSIFQVIVNGYLEIQWDDVFDFQILRPNEINFEITNEQVKQGTIFAARILLRDMQNRLKKLKTAKKDIEGLSRRNVVEHCYINLLQTLANVYKDEEMINECLKGFTYFGLKNDNIVGSDEGEVIEPDKEMTLE